MSEARNHHDGVCAARTHPSAACAERSRSTRRRFADRRGARRHRQGHPPHMTKLRGAFIGFGKIAELGHWPSYAASADVEIVAVMDPSSERQEVAKRLKPGLKTYSTVE